MFESDIVVANAWRLFFDDGSEIIAHDDHLWLTYTYKERDQLTKRTPEYRAWRRKNRKSRVSGNKSKKFTESLVKRNKARVGEGVLPPPTGKIRTTSEIVDTLTVRHGITNHAIPVTKALDLPEKDLLIDPYLLGLWLGDGHSDAGSITTMDEEVVKAVSMFYEISNVTSGNSGKANTYSFKGLVTDLRSLGVLNNKHVPEDYLWGSPAQRLALLQGLMDSDGSVCNGSAEFTSTIPVLAEAVAHLLRSFGNKATVTEKDARLYDKYCGKRYVVKCRPNLRVFRLSRKADKQKLSTRMTTRFHYIVGAERTGFITMKCIRVSAKDNLFLAGKSMVPTHNTQALLILCAMRCMQVPGAHVLFLRRTFPELEMSAIKVSHELLAGTGPKYDGGKHRWEFPHKGSPDSVLQFGYLEKDNDVFRYYSAEFDLICFDELTQFTKHQYIYMLARCRTSKQGVQPLIRSASNPGGVGMAWVKKRFIDACKGGKVYKDPGTGMTRKFIPAKLTDNPHLLKADPMYVQRLNQLPEHLRKMLLEGSWETTSGLAFPEFSYDIHVCETFAPERWWKRWLANDPGYTDPFVWYSFAVGPDGKVYVYREITRGPKDPKLTYSEQAKLVVDLSYTKDPETGEMVADEYEFKVTGRDAFSKNPETGKCMVDYYHEGGLYGFLEPPRGDKTDRRFRKAVLHEYLRPYKNQEGKLTAKLQIMDCCEKLIETLPVLMEDERDPERVAISAADHYYDALGYGLIKWHSVISPAPQEGVGTIAQIKNDLAKRVRKQRRRRYW